MKFQNVFVKVMNAPRDWHDSAGNSGRVMDMILSWSEEAISGQGNTYLRENKMKVSVTDAKIEAVLQAGIRQGMYIDVDVNHSVKSRGVFVDNNIYLDKFSYAQPQAQTQQTAYTQPQPLPGQQVQQQGLYPGQPPY